MYHLSSCKNVKKKYLTISIFIQKYPIYTCYRFTKIIYSVKKMIMADLRKLGFIGTIGDEDEIEVEPESSDSDNEEAQVICALFVLS